MFNTYSLSISEGRFLGTSSRPFLEQSAELWSHAHSQGHLAFSIRSFRSSPRTPGSRAISNKHSMPDTFMLARLIMLIRREQKNCNKKLFKKYTFDHTGLVGPSRIMAFNRIVIYTQSAIVIIVDNIIS